MQTGKFKLRALLLFIFYSLASHKDYIILKYINTPHLIFAKNQ